MRLWRGRRSEPLGLSKEPLFPEVSVEAERRAQSILPHSLEAHAVHQTQFLSGSGKDRSHPLKVLFSGDPVDFEQRNHILMQSADCRQPGPSRRQVIKSVDMRNLAG